jgi:hypothetical protein
MALKTKNMAEKQFKFLYTLEDDENVYETFIYAKGPRRAYLKMIFWAFCNKVKKWWPDGS